MELHAFQGYNSTTHHLYLVFICVHHSKASLLPSPFIPLHPLLPPHPLPQHGDHHAGVCVSEFLVCLIPSALSPSALTHPLSASVCFPCLWAVSIFCSLPATKKWDHMVLVFCDWLMSLSTMLPRPIPVSLGKGTRRKTKHRRGHQTTKPLHNKGTHLLYRAKWQHGPWAPSC